MSQTIPSFRFYCSVNNGNDADSNNTEQNRELQFLVSISISSPTLGKSSSSKFPLYKVREKGQHFRAESKFLSFKMF